MTAQQLTDGLLWYLGLVILITFHEFGHAWMAWKCGDDTPYLQGRVTINPLAHIDPIGTVLMPLLMIFLSGSFVSGFILGWGKPVMVNLGNLRNRTRDDVLVTAAGPWMNLVLAVVLVGIAKLGIIFHSANVTELSLKTAELSMMLFFFNLIPIPPLDGSKIARVIVGMSYETYLHFSRYGVLILLLVLNSVPAVREAISSLADGSLRIIAGWFGMPI
jgi:Zn-dependent protease